MAGDTKDPGPDIEVADPFALMLDRLHDQSENLGRIAEALSGDGQEILAFGVIGGPATPLQSQHPKLRVAQLIISVDAVETVTFLVGTARYSFVVGIGVTSITFPLVLERGVDISFIGATDMTGFFYVTGNPE